MNERPLTRPWEDIAKFYRDVATVPAQIELGRLCERIAKSELVSGIHAWTDVNTLCIVQAEAGYSYSGPILRIVAVSGTELEFRFVDTRIKSRQWVRVVPATAAWERLIVFLDQLHWFNDLSSLVDIPAPLSAEM